MYMHRLLPIILEHTAPAAWRSLLQRSVDRADAKVFYLFFSPFVNPQESYYQNNHFC